MRLLKNEIILSEKSKEFLENLNLYLFSSGKNTEEIEEITEELEIHLSEAEKNGKSIEKIIGKTPKEYMEMISNEMVIDYRTWFKYICLFIIGSFSITIIPDLLEGTLSYSVLEIVGHIIVGAIFIATIFKGFKYIATKNHSGKKQGLILMAIVMLPMALFGGLIYLNRVIETPIIYFGNMWSLMIGIIAALFIIGMSFWAKTGILIVVVAFLTLPNYLLALTSLQYETQLITSWLITCSGIAIYFWISSRLEKGK